MKHVMGLAIVVFVGIIAWRIGENLSSDAVSIAVGVLFGVLAGIPTALLVLVGGRRQDAMPDPRSQPQNYPQNFSQNEHRLPDHQMAYPQQSPVIVFAPGQPPPTNAGYGYSSGHSSNHLSEQPQHGRPMLEAQPDAMTDGMYGNEAGYGSGPRHFKVVGEQEEWVDGF